MMNMTGYQRYNDISDRLLFIHNKITSYYFDCHDSTEMEWLIKELQDTFDEFTLEEQVSFMNAIAGYNYLGRYLSDHQRTVLAIVK